MVRFLFAAVLTAICLCGCVPPGRGAEPQCTLLPLPQTTLAARQSTLPADCPCGCPCSTGAACTCPPGQCQCAACPGKVTLDGLKQRAMRDNKRLVVWTGTTGHVVTDCLTCRDETMTAPQQSRPFVSVGVPSANGLIWWQFPASVTDSVLQTVRTDGVHELMPPAAQPSPSDWRHWQAAYPAPYLNAAPMPTGYYQSGYPVGSYQQAVAPVSYAPAFGGMAGCQN